MSNIDKQELREAAERATPGDWKYSTFDCAITDDTSSLAIVRMDSGHLNDEQSALNGAFIAAANPATVLALLDELERKEEQRANWFQMAQKLGSDLDAAEKRIAELSQKADIYDMLRQDYGLQGSLVDFVDWQSKRIAELEAREVVLPQRYSMLHRVDFDEPYHTEMAYKQHQVLEALHDAGVNVAAAGKGEAS